MGEKKVKPRMGMHNRITKERWEAIKDDCNQGMPTTEIAKRRSVSEGTVRKVRRSKDFHEYRIRADEQVRSRKPIVVIAPKSGLAFEDFGAKPIFSSKLLKQEVKKTLSSDRCDKEGEKTAHLVGIVMLGWVLIIAAIAITLVITVVRLAMGAA